MTTGCFGFLVFFALICCCFVFCLMNSWHGRVSFLVLALFLSHLFSTYRYFTLTTFMTITKEKNVLFLF